ncbi:hypothetical protein H1R20_g572, partial [Candolleomyces eurysporus]
MAFLGFLRCSEFTVKAGKAFSMSSHPTCHSIEFYPDSSNPTHACLNLPASKTDPFCKAISIYLAAAPGTTTCPVAALNKLFAKDLSDPDGPLFHNPNRSPLSHKFFIKTIQFALQAAGYKLKDFAGHSFRCSAASSAAAAGCQDHKMQLLSWWVR